MINQISEQFTFWNYVAKNLSWVAMILNKTVYSKLFVNDTRA